MAGHLLRIALLYCLVGTVLTGPVFFRNAGPKCQKTKVAVLGAGLAGITAGVSPNGETD